MARGHHLDLRRSERSKVKRADDNYPDTQQTIGGVCPPSVVIG